MFVLYEKEMDLWQKIVSRLVKYIGAVGITNANVERGDNINIMTRMFVHKYCRINYVKN